MTQKRLLVCDHCSREVPVDEVAGWLSVSTIVYRVEANLERYERLLEAGRAEDVIDAGEFCSLRCLSDWAGVRGSLKELDTEVTEQ